VNIQRARIMFGCMSLALVSALLCASTVSFVYAADSKPDAAAKSDQPPANATPAPVVEDDPTPQKLEEIQPPPASTASSPSPAQSFTQDLAKYGNELGGNEKGGRLVLKVKPGSRGASWGIKVGDILHNVLKPANIQFERDGKKTEVDLTQDKAWIAAIQ